MKVSFSIILDRRKKVKDGYYPLLLRVYYSKQTKYIRLGKKITEPDFEKAQAIRPRDRHKQNKMLFEAYLERAIQIKDSMEEWNYTTFKNRFIGGNTDETEILSLMRLKIKQLEESGRFGNSKHYQTNLNQIKTFLGKRKTLHFHEVDKAWLQRLERWYVDNDRSARSAGVVMQSIRAIFNDATAKGAIKSTPFGKGGYKIPQSMGKPRALKMEQLNLLMSYQTESREEKEALLYFKLIYLWSGIAVKDLFSLKWEAITGDVLRFRRSKTKNTSGADISLPVGDQVKEILNILSYSSKPKEYILPVFEGTKNDDERLAKRKNKTKWLNKWLKRIGGKLGFDLPLTTYVARHTYATMSKRLGIPTSYIQNSFGHTTEKTTQLYLGKFEDDKAVEFQNKLIPTQEPDRGERASDG